jgi:hypothetical protein
VRLFTAHCSDSEPMRTWSHDERLLGRPQTKDSFRRRRRDAQGPGSSHLLREPLLGQTIRKEKASGGESLAPKKRPGSAPKLDETARKLLEEDLKERPFASLQERCEYIGAITGI